MFPSYVPEKRIKAVFLLLMSFSPSNIYLFYFIFNSCSRIFGHKNGFLLFFSFSNKNLAHFFEDFFEDTISLFKKMSNTNPKNYANL